jgi:signal peptidase I
MIKQVFSFIIDLAKIIILALLIVVPIRYFIFQPFMVRGASMEPNYHQNDYLIVDELSYRLRDPVRGEVVVFNYPHNPSQRFIKRIIGLPGETISFEGGEIKIINSQGEPVDFSQQWDYLANDIYSQMFMDEITLGPDQYFVMGDNRPVSFDSRKWGPLPENFIIGRVVFNLSITDVFAFSFN